MDPDGSRGSEVRKRVAAFAIDPYGWHSSAAQSVGAATELTLRSGDRTLEMRDLSEPVRIGLPMAVALDEEDFNPYEGARCGGPTREECEAELRAMNNTYNGVAAECKEKESSILSIFEPDEVSNCTGVAEALRAKVDAKEEECNLLLLPVCSGRGVCDGGGGNCTCQGPYYGNTCGRKLRCAFWNGSAFDSEGCTEVGVEGGRLQCNCSHLTLFEVLYEVDWSDADVYSTLAFPMISLPFSRWDALWELVEGGGSMPEAVPVGAYCDRIVTELQQQIGITRMLQRRVDGDKWAVTADDLEYDVSWRVPGGGEDADADALDADALEDDDDEVEEED